MYVVILVMKSLLIILLIGASIPTHAQLKNLKILKEKVGKEVEKVVKKEVKPLTIDYKVSKVRYNPLKSLNTVGLDIDFIGHNPNRIGVSLDRIEFDLYIDGKHASTFYNEKKIKIPKEGDFAFEEKADLKLSALGKAVFNAIINKKAKYRIDGTYFLDTPVGIFPIKVTLTEKEM